MAIRNDYLLDQIARLVEGILASLERLHSGGEADAICGLEAVVGDVLDMDAETALSLSPASLVTMMQLSAVDESLAVYAVYALGCAADAYDARGDAIAQVRRAQAQALADSYGFAATAVPPEVEEALAARS